MKTRLRYSLLVILVLVLFCSFCCAEESLLPPGIEAIAAEYEPGPHPFVSYRERNLLTPSSVTPEQFIKEIDACTQPEDVTLYLHSIGINFDFYDGEYVYFYRHNRTYGRFPLNKSVLGYDEIVTVTYSYDEEQHDNFVFIFAQRDGIFTLIDCISSFGAIQIVTNPDSRQIWLVGKTGSDHQTIRWYHVQSGKIVLSYLSYGINPDRMDYHVKAEAVIDPRLNQAFLEDGVLTLLKQISVIDLRNDMQPGDETHEIILYTQAQIYEAQKNGEFLLRTTATFSGLGLQETAEALLR